MNTRHDLINKFYTNLSENIKSQYAHEPLKKYLHYLGGFSWFWKYEILLTRILKDFEYNMICLYATSPKTLKVEYDLFVAAIEKEIRSFLTSQKNNTKANELLILFTDSRKNNLLSDKLQEMSYEDFGSIKTQSFNRHSIFNNKSTLYNTTEHKPEKSLTSTHYHSTQKKIPVDSDSLRRTIVDRDLQSAIDQSMNEIPLLELAERKVKEKTNQNFFNKGIENSLKPGDSYQKRFHAPKTSNEFLLTQPKLSK